MLTRKYQIEVSILTWLSVIVLVGLGFEMKCPEPSQWKFRKKTCGTSENYSCLYDIQSEEYEESCSDKIDFVKAGKRYVRTGGLDSIDCIDSRYQKRKFWSNETSDCEMLKSTCSEEGQVDGSDGSSTGDRTCRCDTLNGYGFITSHTHISSCIPSIEDCYCYRTTYAKSEIHTREFDSEKITKTSRKYLPVRESVIKLTESRSSTGTSRTVYTLDKGHIWKKLYRHGDGIGYIRLKDLVGCSVFLTVMAIAALIFGWDENIGSFFGLFEAQYSNLEHLIQNNWGDLKRNGNATSMRKKFIEANLLTENDPEIDSSIKRARLVELVIYKCIQNIKTKEDIQLVHSEIFKNLVPASGHGKGIENTPWRVTLKDMKRCKQILSSKRKLIETTLKIEDIITIKDDLVEHFIISLLENNNLLQLEKQCGEGRSSLTENLMELIIKKLSAGSYQCFIQTLEKIEYKEHGHDRLKGLIHLLKNDSLDDELFLGSTQRHQVNLKHVKSIYHTIDIEGIDNFIITIKAENEDGQEVEDVYTLMKKKYESINRIISSHLGGKVAQTRNGSLVIDMQMMERNMQGHLINFIRSGSVTTLIQQLFSEISLRDIKQNGKLYVKVKIQINDDFSLLEPRSTHSSNITSFVIDNQSFLLEELDTDTMEIALGKHDIRIPTDGHCTRRKEKAKQILSFVVKQAYQRYFIHVVTLNEDNKFIVLRRRLEAYRKVYEAEPHILRKNILIQFLEITRNIDIYDIQDVLVQRKAIDYGILFDIKIKFVHNREIGMATLLLNILKSDGAVRAFVDALFIMNSYLAEKMLRCQSELAVIEKGPMVEIHEKSPENRLLIEGYFTIDIKQRGFHQPSPRNDPDRSLIKLTKERHSLTNKMIDFEKELLIWLREAKLVIKTLEDLAEELDAHFTRINKAKIGGSAAGIVGGVIGIVGLALSPFTFGASLGLTIAGGAVAGIGGVTVGGSLIADNVLSKKTKTKAEERLSVYSSSLESIKDTCLDLTRRMENLEDNFPDWVRFWTLFTRGQESNTCEFSWEETQRLLRKSFLNSDTAARFIIGEGVGAGVRIAGAAVRVTGTSLHVISGVIGALVIPLDIFTIVDSAIDLHKKNKHETSKIIIQISEILSKELPTKENIKMMIRITINSI